MHGIIHTSLQKFVEASFGVDSWTTLLERCNLSHEIFTPLRTYPDEQFTSLLREAVALSGKPEGALLEAFGEFVVPTYLARYGALLKPEWRTLEVLENTEETVHRVVRMRDPGAAPPRLHMRRTAPDEVELTYDSERRLCAVARGIARGVAKQFGEPLHVLDRSCMLRGDPVCVIVFRRGGS